MNRIILNFGLIFFALGVSSAQTAKEVKDRINAIERDAEDYSSKTNSIRNNDLPKLPEQILKIAESNKLIIETKNQLKKYEGKGDAAKDCQALFNANYYSTIDQLYVQANDLITPYLDVNFDDFLKNLNAQVDNWDKLSAEDKDKINKNIDEISTVIDVAINIISTLVQNILKIVENNLFPNQAEENISTPVNECLKKIESQ